jgi:hypothetical protein
MRANNQWREFCTQKLFDDDKSIRASSVEPYHGNYLRLCYPVLFLRITRPRFFLRTGAAENITKNAAVSTTSVTIMISGRMKRNGNTGTLAVNVTCMFMFAPFTIIDPVDGEAMWPDAPML